VLFLGVLYHLRHPLLALDLIREHVVRDLFVVQSMQRGDSGEEPIAEDYPFAETAVFERPSWPHLSFVEHRYAGDDTNWWVPNRACAKAMLRSAGFVIDSNPEEEVYLCRPGPRPAGCGAVYPARSARPVREAAA
jgi:tRNA (mo5U34)-methyltransferase